MTLKIISGVVLLVIVLTGTIYGYGSSLPQKNSFTQTVFINASPDVIYGLAIDAQSQDSWRQDVIDVTMNPGGKTWTEHTDHGDILFEITQEDRPHTFGLKFRGKGFEGAWKGNFTAVGTGTEVSLVETTSIENPFFRVLSKIMKFNEKLMTLYVRDLTAESERLAGKSS